VFTFVTGQFYLLEVTQPGTFLLFLIETAHACNPEKGNFVSWFHFLFYHSFWAEPYCIASFLARIGHLSCSQLM